MNSYSNLEHSPRVTIIVAAYGQEPYLGETLESLLAQTFTDWEAIITDDGSKDNVAEVAQRYVVLDSRFKFLHSDNHGLAGVRNLAAKDARGEYLMMLDGDDRIGPRYLEECVKILDTDKGVKAVFAYLQRFGAENSISKVEYLGYPALLINNPIYVSGMIRTSDFKAAGGFDDRFRTGLEDWEFWIRFIPENNPDAIRVIPEVMFYYRQKEDSMFATMVARREIMDGYIHLIFTKHEKIYRKYFGNDIKEWMLLKRVFSNETKYLLNPECRIYDTDDTSVLNDVCRTTMRLASDISLTQEQKLDILKSFVSKWDKSIKESSNKLSAGKRLRWALLSNSPKAFIRYAIWKNH